MHTEYTQRSQCRVAPPRRHPISFSSHYTFIPCITCNLRLPVPAAKKPPYPTRHVSRPTLTRQPATPSSPQHRPLHFSTTPSPLTAHSPLLAPPDALSLRTPLLPRHFSWKSRATLHPPFCVFFFLFSPRVTFILRGADECILNPRNARSTTCSAEPRRRVRRLIIFTANYKKKYGILHTQSSHLTVLYHSSWCRNSSSISPSRHTTSKHFLT